jgi:uncharacterized protein (TIGR02145 family)
MMKAIRNISFLFVALSFVLASCTSNTGLPPTVTTWTTRAVTQTTVTCGGTVTSDGGLYITARGVCWSPLPNPTIKNNVTTDSTGTGNFSSLMESLQPATTYYVRAYATNANGTGYGNIIIITTPPDAGSPNGVMNPDLTYSTMTDIDGNVYQTITIGNQTWMAQNLMVTKYRNGAAIPNETNDTKWNALATGAQCTYNNNRDSNTVAKFGRLYNFYAVTDQRNLAPTGWHVASDSEWATLINYLAANLGTSTSVAQALAAKTDWNESYNAGDAGYIDQYTYTSLNNSSGFSGLPAGIRGDYGGFNYVTMYSGWWTSDENDKTTSRFRSLNYYGLTVGKNSYDKHYGLSVRCVKD